LAKDEMVGPKQPETDKVRINVRRYVLTLLAASVCPLVVGVLVDDFLNTFPYASMVLGMLSIVLALWFVMRPVITEFCQLVDRVSLPAEDRERKG